MENVPPPAEELAILDRELAQLDARRAQLLARRSWLLIAMRPPPAAPVVWAARPSGAQPFAPPHEASAPSVQNLLLSLGGVLLAIAAIAFTLVSWGHMGIGGRSAVLGAVTVAALAAPVALLRRRLTSTAESVAALGLVLTVLDAYALHRVALPETDGLGYAAFASAVLAGLWTAYGLSLDRLRIPLPTAVLTAQLPLPLWSLTASAGAPPLEWALLATAALGVAVALWGRQGGPGAVRVCAVTGAVVTGGWALLIGCLRSVSADTPLAALAPAVLLLVGAGLALFAAWRAPSAAVVTSVVAGLTAIVAVGGTARAAVPEEWAILAYLLCAVALLPVVRAGLPRGLTSGLTGAAGAVHAAAALSALPLVVFTLAGPAAQLNDIWSGAPEDARGVLGGLELAESGLTAAPLVLLIVAAVLATASRWWPARSAASAGSLRWAAGQPSGAPGPTSSSLGASTPGAGRGSPPPPTGAPGQAAGTPDHAAADRPGPTGLSAAGEAAVPGGTPAPAAAPSSPGASTSGTAAGSPPPPPTGAPGAAGTSGRAAGTPGQGAPDRATTPPTGAPGPGPGPGAGAGAGVAGASWAAARSGGLVLAWAGLLVLPPVLDLGYAAAVTCHLLLAIAALALAVRPTRRATATATATATRAVALVCGLVGAVSVALLSLATRPATFAVLGVLVVALAAAAAAAAAARPPRAIAPVQALLACAATVFATGLVGAVAADAGLPAHRAALALLAVPAVVALLAARLGRHPVALPLELTGATAGLLAVGLAAGHRPTLALVLALCGVIAAGTALRAEHRPVAGYLAAVLFVLATWVRLAASGVASPEAYTLPVTVPALVVGVLRRRRDPEASSWTAYGPGLAATLLPSLVAAWGDEHWARPLALGGAALVLTLVGARLRLQALLALGGAALSLVALHELAPYVVQAVGALPRWLPPALAGLLLLGVGATYEQRLRDARKLRNTLARMH